MKNIGSRIAKLEKQLPKENFLVVIARKGETYHDASKRVMQEMNINWSIDNFFVIFLNLHGNGKIKKIEHHGQTVLDAMKDQNVKALGEDDSVFLIY